MTGHHVHRKVWARIPLIEVHAPHGLLLIGSPALRTSLPFIKGTRSLTDTPQTRDQVWLLQTIRGDPWAVRRLRAEWSEIAPMLHVGRLPDHQLVSVVSQYIASGQLAGLYLSDVPTAAMSAAQDQAPSTRHGASGSWDASEPEGVNAGPVSTWSKEQKVLHALRLASTSSRIPRDMAEVVLLYAVGPTAIRFVAVLVVWVALQFVPGANITVDGVALVLAWSIAGLIGIHAVIDFILATIAACQATSEQQLQQVSDRYVDDLISLGTLFLPKLASKLKIKIEMSGVKPSTPEVKPRTPSRLQDAFDNAGRADPAPRVLPEEPTPRVPPEEPSKVVSDGKGGFKLNRKAMDDPEKISGQPEARNNANEANREATAADDIAGHGDVKRVHMGRDADEFLNGSEGKQKSPDVIAETENGRFRLAEAKGADTDGAIAQFQDAGNKLGADNIVSQDLYCNKLGPGYKVNEGGFLTDSNNRLIRANGKPVSVHFTN